MNQSKNHHYIPIFFLKGFCNENGLIFVYDKKLDKFFPPSIPDRHFFKKHLNNLIHENKFITSSEEDVYGPIDNFGTKILKKFIDNKSITDNSTDYDKADLLKFMINLFWRTPTSDLFLRTLIKKEGLCNSYFGLYNEKTKERYADDDEEVQEIKDKILTDKEFAKHLKVIVANSDASNEEIITLLKLWNLFNLNTNSTNEFLISDLPLLHLNESPTLPNVFKKVIFPISKNKVLILNKNNPKFLDDFTINGINLCIMQESERFVGSGNKDLLEYYVTYYKEVRKKDDTEYSVNELFEYIDNLN
ncbi:DUF4238 domain-containing protein [Gelidibacter salicanalis]|uniref:DUF4238 domain-containing protein n=1 Tax=Gelidibacter salicanalis TaxID=291193 RepID=A0A934NIL0_9FLAO|nr:DUF4238 domain-containing protein [Gelidibacter salicanalis]MBJ7882241.1 DUF4238 domain-containing protein [Gelidibacter salicanalis]